MKYPELLNLGLDDESINLFFKDFIDPLETLGLRFLGGSALILNTTEIDIDVGAHIAIFQFPNMFMGNDYWPYHIKRIIREVGSQACTLDCQIHGDKLFVYTFYNSK
jgi:hypothetical protein